MGWLSDLVSNPVDTVLGSVNKVIDNPIPAITAYATGNPAALLGYAAPQPSGMTPQQSQNYFTGGVSTIGGLLQGRTDTAAAKALANQLRQAGTSAAQMASFKPVGTTTRFGTSNYRIDPAPGGLKADYSLSPLAAEYQKSLAGMTGQGLMQGQQIQSLAGQYLGESPEAVRQRVMQQRMDLLAPSRERELAKILNTNYQTGTGGLSVGESWCGKIQTWK